MRWTVGAIVRAITGQLRASSHTLKHIQLSKKSHQQKRTIDRQSDPQKMKPHSQKVKRQTLRRTVRWNVVFLTATSRTSKVAVTTCMGFNCAGISIAGSLSQTHPSRPTGYCTTGLLVLIVDPKTQLTVGAPVMLDCGSHRQLHAPSASQHCSLRTAKPNQFLRYLSAMQWLL